MGALGAPFERYRFSFEDAVVDSIIEQLGRGAGGKLSALQIVCTALYDLVSRREQPRKITFEDLESIGGVEGSIEQFLDNQLLECGKTMGLPPVGCADETTRWKEALHGLARVQPDGTITTDLKSEQVLRKELADSRLDFTLTTNHLIATRLLRETNVVDAATGQLIRCFGLGHDTLGLVLRNCKVTGRSTSQAPWWASGRARVGPKSSLENSRMPCSGRRAFRTYRINSSRRPQHPPPDYQTGMYIEAHRAPFRPVEKSNSEDSVNFFVAHRE